MTANPDRIAVVGTDTGVGKTVVTAGLTAWLRSNGIDARALKPVQTGATPDSGPTWSPLLSGVGEGGERDRSGDPNLAGDAAFVARTCDDPDAATCPGYLEEPLAPRVAAERAAIDLSYEDLLATCERRLEACEIGIVEGIGGLRVPLADGREVIDLVADLECPAVLVARSDLGTLNHTALSVEALERRGIPVRAIVCNEYAGETVAERTNPAELERLTGRPVETIPPLAVDEPATVAAAVGDALSTHLEG